MEDDSVFTGGCLLRDVHENFKVLRRSCVQLFKSGAGDRNVPDDINTSSISYASERVIETIWSISCVFNIGRQRDRTAWIHVNHWVARQRIRTYFLNL